MAISNFIPEIWSARLLANLDKNLVLAARANTDWEGEIRNIGDRVHIQRPAGITVNSYTGSAITYETPTSTTRTLTVDQDKYWAFKVDDLDRVQANIQLVDRYTERAAYAMRDDVDQYLASLYTAAGLTDIALDLGTDDFYDKVVLAGQQLDEANVPTEGRWLIVSPKGYADLLKNTNFIHATVSGDQVLRTGQIGMIGGFTVFKSNNMANTTGNYYKYLYGTNDAVTWARQLLGTPEAMRLEDTFEDGVRGRMAYGAKVVEPNALGTITSDET